MVPKKGRSKRVTLKDKYKIQKKCADAKRKAKKEAKANPQSKRAKKDPGIPNMWPYKEQLMRQMEERKQRMDDEKVRQREARRKVVEQKRKLSMNNMVKEAEKRTAEFERKESMVEESDMNAWTDNSRRAYFREFKKVVEEADVVLEVLDARDPMGCRCEHIEQMIMASGTGKHVVLVLNKIDLVPKDIVMKWLQHLRQFFPTVAFKASTQEQRQRLGTNRGAAEDATDDMLTGSESLGTETLIKLLKNYCRSANLKKAITVGIVGYPNVGKSSLINSLKRARTCVTGATPGVTKSLQAVSLDKDIKLLDSPGIVFTSNNSDSDVILRNCVNVDTLPDPVKPVELILERCNKEQVMELYEVPNFANVTEFLMHLSIRRGKLKKGGIADLEAAAKSVLQDWNIGAIPFYTLPPAAPVTSKTTIVAGLSKEFDLNALLRDDTAMLASLDGEDSGKTFMAMAPGQAPALDDSMLTSEEEEDEEEESMNEDEEEDDDEVAMKDDDDAVVIAQAKTKKGGNVDAFQLTKTHIAAQDKKLKGKLATKQQFMTEEEMELNPQTNKNKKKTAKQAKKEATRQERKGHTAALLINSVGAQGNDAYNFATDYVAFDDEEM